MIPARPEYLLLARLALTGVARLAHADEEALADLRLAVTEAAANACRHAYEDGQGDVTIQLDPERRRTSSRWSSRTTARASTSESVAEWRAEELGEDGMGLAIIRAIADDVEIGPRAERLGHAASLYALAALSAAARSG